MSKKKIIGLCIAGALAIGCVGGSLAWFTSSDSVTNPFSTASTDNSNNPDSGIKIEEDFDHEHAGNLLPGDTVKKDVAVTNKATYDQLIRVKITKVWKDGEGKVQGDDLSTDNIKLNFSKNLGEQSGQWIKGTDGYYYYNGIVKSNKTTPNLLESVTFASSGTESDTSINTDNKYKGLKFDVIVDSEGIQAANGAAADAWKSAPQAIKDLGAGSNTNSTDTQPEANNQ
ncbi:BsaA family SipW-dependent biofilm matrix protein [Clostridium sp. B9]|uniref:BsaA family SipW-dependent biofilm matrix protein n=1 Tax=Clostridium sp. B9 TaxID=3423224 RepID=UPI003D2EF2A2